MEQNHCKCRKTNFKVVEIVEIIYGRNHSESGNDITKFHIKVRKPHLKLRKALFKRSLERTGKHKK
jgi:hypothetical protein